MESLEELSKIYESNEKNRCKDLDKTKEELYNVILDTKDIILDPIINKIKNIKKQLSTMETQEKMLHNQVFSLCKHLEQNVSSIDYLKNQLKGFFI
ncbi:uncharacterized protein T551_03183 [Pneumocystis jirovecii RU7]|uniref:Biogenesis of lysosome-related organelles complex 1 subunit 7 n=1 Tax=Pneumocystis jirovecii (strain RU7) TaxID=1408657 RepID=A0A0W4ZFP2_PNEJ7|nr:uncharacterized protein T551_03183 [Pneumocystis jirovecii RU7]KTW27189.1 hypothetical protein T551_03183 [Pneumocystis jirovecii RU7]